MTYKRSDAPVTTITRNTSDLSAITGNVYEAIAIIAKRADQISTHLKTELDAKLAEFASSVDSLEEIFENREQIEISRFYERLPKPPALAIEEFLQGKIYYRKPDTEEKSKEL